MDISNISKKYAEVREEIANKVKEMVINNGNAHISLNEIQSKLLKYFTDYNIVEVGINENVSKELYIKTDNGHIVSFDIISIDKQYNILSIMSDWF